MPSLLTPERNISLSVPPGSYNVTWIFRVNYLSGSGLLARGYLKSFRFTGVPNGGAYRCEGCPVGTGLNATGQLTCPTCEPGYYNDVVGVRGRLAVAAIQTCFLFRCLVVSSPVLSTRGPSKTHVSWRIVG